ncbi:mechanosensitive ion channel [Hymenobacter sp. BRD128]|uniref:mechanosensitive ion channel domain-containing protein n=1 Tax=Hymenobacter sp. BRD128 TaxID=2675878 RepID=UPI001565CC2F|nr:mechanosensitive ion channel domain-containing protein [Hymenobacter sp. BRD128]QKG56030.1 mechanosensitive ion channel [Hymenobacter sp. BRD128]
MLLCLPLSLLEVAAGQAPPKATAQAKARPAAPLLPDSLARRIEKAYFTLSRINGAARRGADMQDLSDDLPQIEENLETISQNLDQYGNVVDVKQLQMYRVLLADMQEQLGAWRTDLAISSQQLATTQARLDTLTTQLAPTTAQPAATPAIARALARLRTKQDRATQLLASRRHTVTGFQTRVSESYILGLELQDVVREQMGRFNRRNSQAELPPLWQPGRIVADDQTSALVRQSYAAQRSLVGYYFTEHWDYWVWMVVVAGGFFGWVFRNFRFLRRAAAESGSGTVPAATLVLTDHRLHYLRPVPVAAALLVVFSLAPFLDLQPPATYTDLLQVLLLLTLTALGWRSWPRPLFWYWLAIVGAFFVLNFTYAQRAPGLGARWAMLLLNAGAVALGYRFGQYLRAHRVLAGFVKPVALLFVGLNGLALLANAYGRVSLAKMFTTTAIFGLTQVVALSAFVRIVTEAFYLQVQRSRQAGGLNGRLGFGKMESGLRKSLTAVVSVLWLMLFTTNLNLYNLFYRVIGSALTAPHKLGSTVFTLGSVLLFVGIIFLTIQLQKYVGYFFGETDDEFSVDTDRKGSWMVAIRLAILAVGIFLATLASGLPVDKIAIVLGALGVGIGLGLQNIINNLVSGVILIFERPFQVGDYIEVKGQTGRVKDIGIRASKLISQAGSEIILPNGDLLSNHVINWTLSNNHIRTELALNLAPDIDLDEARRLISEEILNNPNTLHKIAPEILLNNVATTGYDLKALFWINNIRQEEALKSELLAGIYHRLTQAGIAMR